MRRAGAAPALAAMLILAAPGGAAPERAIRASLRIGVPSAGNITVAETRFKIRNIRANIKSLPAPRLSVLNKTELGSNVVVVASVAREVKDRTRFDLTFAVIARAGATASGDAVLVMDEPGFVATPHTGFTLTTIATTNAIQANSVPKYAFPCGFGHASFLSGNSSGLQPPELSILYSCWAARDEVWIPSSFANSIGARFCGVAMGPAVAGSTYAAVFSCNHPVNAFAIQDPLKNDGVTALDLHPPLAGRCQAPFQKPYIGICSLTMPLPANSIGAFTFTLGTPLPSHGEYGFTVQSGNSQDQFSMQVVDIVLAKKIIDKLVAKNSYGVSDLVAAQAALTKGDIATACRHLKGAWISLVPKSLHKVFEDELIEVYGALDALNCSPY